VQRSFDDMGAPLHEVTFVVLDLETTGGSPLQCAITEVGAVKLRGGVCLGTLQTLVNPGVPIPREIVYLTGITEAMVIPAPPIEEVLPSLVEFLAGTVLVGHNVRFDVAFMQAALKRAGWPPLDMPVVDTCALARRLLSEEVPNHKLSTLADHFRTRARPIHRALDDALTTGELLHCLLERAGSLGVLGLDDLLELPTIKGHPQLSKLHLTTGLPRRPGVYLFRDRTKRVIYVGKAIDLRRRVRSYFSGDGRRKVGQLLREVHTIDHVVCAGELEAAVLEVRLIHELSPRFNRQLKLWRKYAYLKLTLDERFPRLSVVRAPKAGDGCLYLGPLSSAATAHLVAEAIETAAPLRRCTLRIAKSAGRAQPVRSAPCTPAQLGVATCPCAGTTTPEEYEAIVEQVVRGLTTDPSSLLDPLDERMRALAAAERFEEAAATRDRAAALATALSRQRRLDALRRAGRVVVEVSGEGRSVLDGGRLVGVWEGARAQPDVPPDSPLPTSLVDELACVARWMDTRTARIRLVTCEGTLAWPLPRLPRFEPSRK
jgi:DNA polymerase-3 subunit epsilon